ncbi:MAG: anaerobic magnesium-protoporphyrin IX monomethyl ester cyclase [Planctomycetota bacterium]|jgi:anaerobic magnesium-protoporphyrin IX monomethyl ester cyclase
MKVSLVFPPNRNIPSTPYSGLPLLAGCLSAAGHTVDTVDANLEVVEELLKRPTLERAKAFFDESWEFLDGLEEMTPNQVRHKQGLATLSIVPFDHLFNSEEAVEILRSPEKFLDPDRANWAYDVITNALRAMYSMNPVFYPLAPGYLDDLFNYLETDFVNPVSSVLEEQIIDRILASDPEMIAISIPFNEQVVEAFTILKMIKKRAPHIPTIIGGSIISAFHELLCNDERIWDYVDYVMPGESDESFPEFVTKLSKGEDTSNHANLWWRGEDGVIHKPASRSLPDMNKIASPDFSGMPTTRYFLPHLVVNYQTSRGCYYGKCTFCSFDIKQNFRLRKASLVFEDLQKVQEQTGFRHIMFWDPLTPPRLMRDFSKFNVAQPEEKQFYWGAETKFEKVFTEQAFTDKIYAGGARFLQFGYESGSQRVLDLMVKGNDLTRVHLMLGAMERSNIKVSVQWFIGFPGAQPADDLQSYRYLEEHRGTVLLSSYMGTYAISPDDDIFMSGGDLYDIDLYQKPSGQWDFQHRDGSIHYDRKELDQAFLSRGDAESVTRMAFYIYLTEKPELAHKLSNFDQGGVLPDAYENMAQLKPFLPAGNHIAKFDFDVFTSPEEQGITEDKPGALPKVDMHALYVSNSSVVYPLKGVDLQLVQLADGTRTAEEIVRELGGDVADLEKRMFEFVRRGQLLIPLPEPSDKPQIAIAS